MIKRQRISISGQLQGVGFRPAAHKIANDLNLTGFIYNDTKGVTLELQGREHQRAEFLTRLRSKDKPVMAKINSCRITDIAVIDSEYDFTIKESDPQGQTTSQVTADIAVCYDCLGEMADKNNFRYRYPFINCTNCGPRYSIVKNIPYDRYNTTMSTFRMCDKCNAQYTNVADRRFHAQPVACSKCGPNIRLTDNLGKTKETQTEKVIAETAKLLKAGKIVAIKGIGGFHLAVDALNNDAVKKLRYRKKRDHKPFALMADSIETIKKYAIINESAWQLLKSPQRPIVLLPEKPDSPIAPAVAQGLNTLGFMLCYTPLHYLLFQQLGDTDVEIMVMTSGNISDEPLICKDDQATERLGGIADAFLIYDREIYRQVDDSVTHIIDDSPVLLRRSRGYVPTPILIDKNCSRHILATGGDLKNTFCFVKQNQIICSEHIGDLENAEVYRHYTDSIKHLGKLFEVEPETIVCDLHPGYFSTRYANSKQNVKVLQVQHHWGHICSVLAEHNLVGPVIGIAADGTGFGTDNAIWGCECLTASLDDFDRFSHLAYYTLPGADKASKEAIRPVMGLLKKTYGDSFHLGKFEWLLDRIEPDTNKQQIISHQIDKNINCVKTSSLGRVFDAVAAMAGLGCYNYFEAQLPMALESAITENINEQYDFELIKTAGEPLLLDLDKMIKQLLCDIQQNQTVGIIAAKFHNCIAAALLEMAEQAHEKTKLNTVALSGGIFCNRYLMNRLINLLRKNNFTVLYNKNVPPGDGGLSLGQSAIAAHKEVFKIKV